MTGVMSHSGAHWLGELVSLVGRCESCRWSEARAGGPGRLVCMRGGEGEGEPVKPVWRCAFYAYEPGSLA